MTDYHERRRFSRVNFNTSVTLIQGKQQWQAELLDISLKGLLIKAPLTHACDASQPLHVNITLSEQAEISMATQLAHQEADHIGLECVSIDMDSISHLRRLIELNLDDPAAAERELADLIAQP